MQKPGVLMDVSFHYHSNRSGSVFQDTTHHPMSHSPQKRPRSCISTTCNNNELETLANARNTMAKRLKTTWSTEDRGNPDIAWNLQVIRAMLAMNNEIWKRCERNWVSWDQGYSPGETIFRRQQFKLVKADSRFSTDLKFSVEYETEFKMFDMEPLLACPPNLKIFRSLRHHIPGCPRGFVNFEALLERSLLLHDEVLEPFLVELKKHVESIHFTLGDLEEWLCEPLTVIDFLETSFGVDHLHELTDSGEETLRTCAVSNKHWALFQVGKESERARLTMFLDSIATV